MATIAAPRPVAPRRRVIPLVGQTLAYFHDPLATMRYHYDTNGPVSDYTFVGRRWTMLLGPDACEVALRNADKAFANAGGWGYLIGPFFDRGLMLLDFEEHHHHRRILQEAFTRDRIADYASTLGPAVEARLDAWRPDPAFQAYPALKDLTLDLATQIFMGGADLADADELARVNQAFIDCVQAGLGFVRTSLPGTKWRRGVKGRRLLEEFFSRQVAARRASGGTDLFSALCQIETDDGHRLSDDDIVSHMIFLLMAAHDTSTITVTTMMQHLGQHPEWQERCRAESLALSAHPTLDEIDGLTSLDLVMKECLRLVPPVPGLARQAVKDTEVLGQHIPAGRLVSVGVHLSHHMPELWPDPERFDPERFAEHRREDKVHRYAWEPFGGGVHKCIGLYFGTVEVKMIVHQMLQRFAWTVDPDYVAPMNYHSLPFPKDGLPVDLRPYRKEPHERDISTMSIVVTGGARGIGRATAARFAQQGARVAIGDRDADLARTVADELGSGVVAAELDVTDPASWTAFLEEVAAIGPIDVLVNNAGIMPLGSVLKEPHEVARRIVDVNLHGVIFGTKAVAPGMAERGRGHIVNVASAVGRVAVADGATYSASKFAVVGFSEATRAELEPQGVDVSVVLPAIVQTELAAGVPAARGMKPVTADDVAQVIELTVRKPRPELWVPRWSQGMSKFGLAMPRVVQRGMAKAFRADTVLADADQAARAAYEKRAREG